MHDAIDLLRLLFVYFPTGPSHPHVLTLDDERLAVVVRRGDEAHRFAIDASHLHRLPVDIFQQVALSLAAKGLGLPEGTRTTESIVALARRMERDPNDAEAAVALKHAVAAERAARRRCADDQPVHRQLYSDRIRLPAVFELPHGWPSGAPAEWSKGALRLPDGTSLGGWVPALNDTRTRVVASV